jgi:predicted NBD/HSP70 family sugar kinase
VSIVAGLDVGGTKTLGVVAGTDGRPIAEVRLATRAGSADALLDFVADAAAKLAGEAGVTLGELDAIGVGIPGRVDSAAGTVRDAVNLGLGRGVVALGARLRELSGRPAIVANDVDAAAVGAAHLLGATDLAYLSVGTGIAAGFVFDGRLRRGRRSMVGEIGHLVVDPAGPVCACGQRGCLEAVAAGPAIARRWPTPDGGSPATALALAAADGDERAVTVLAEVARRLASAITLLALTVDPDVLVLGGGVAGAGPAFDRAVRSALDDGAATSDLLAHLDLAGRLVVLAPDAAAGAVGAALLARAASG